MDIETVDEDMERSQKECISQMESKDFIMEPAIFQCLKRYCINDY